jgi:hypothetical protein
VQLQTTDLVDYGFGASAVLAGLVLLPGAGDDVHVADLSGSSTPRPRRR